jgi:hypothetical protein
MGISEWKIAKKSWVKYEEYRNRRITEYQGR